jgi:hypothetical protein
MEINPVDVMRLLSAALDPSEDASLDDALAHVELLEVMVATTPGLLVATRAASAALDLDARLALSARQHTRLVGPVLTSFERLLEPEPALLAEADAMLTPDESLSAVIAPYLDPTSGFEVVGP